MLYSLRYNTLFNAILQCSKKYYCYKNFSYKHMCQLLQCYPFSFLNKEVPPPEWINSPENMSWPLHILKVRATPSAQVVPPGPGLPSHLVPLLDVGDWSSHIMFWRKHYNSLGYVISCMAHVGQSSTGNVCKAPPSSSTLGLAGHTPSLAIYNNLS